MRLNIRNYIIIISSTLLTLNCKSEDLGTKEPVVNISSSQVPESSEVTFQNQSENAVSYRWDFGDGETSSEKSPSHKYLFNGTYIVKACATGANNVEVCKETTVTITDAPMIKIYDETLMMINYQALYNVRDGNLILKVLGKEDAIAYKDMPLRTTSTVSFDVNQNNKVDSGIDFKLSISSNSSGNAACYANYTSGGSFSFCNYETESTIVGDDEINTFTIPLSIIQGTSSPNKSQVYVSFEYVLYNNLQTPIERLIFPSGGEGERWNFRTFEKKYIIKLP